MRKVFVTCVLVGMAGILGVRKSMAITAEDIIQTLQIREESIETLKGEFEIENNVYKREWKPSKTKTLYKWVKKGKMRKVSKEFTFFPESLKTHKEVMNYRGQEFITWLYTPKEVLFFDGEVTKIHIPERRQGSILCENLLSVCDGGPADFFLLRFGREPLSAYLKKDDVKLKYAGKKKLAGEPCHLLEVSEWEEAIRISLYLSEKKGLAPIRFEYKWKNQSCSFDGKLIKALSEFQKYEDIWLPSKVVSITYSVYPDREEVSMKKTMIVKELEVNIKIPQKDLILKFPSGTHVSDGILGISYIVP